MTQRPASSPLDECPRILTVGSCRDALGLPGEGLIDALSALCHVHAAPSSSSPFSAVAAMSRTLAAARRHSAELIHLLDARHVALGRWLRSRSGLPVTVSVSARDCHASAGWPRVDRRLQDLDLAFASDPAVISALREHAPMLDVLPVAPVARPLPWPTRRRMVDVTRALAHMRPGRLVVAIPWPSDERDLRWYRDAIAPMVDGGPASLVFGAPTRRAARLLFGAQNLQNDFRVLAGRINADTIAAIARCVDAFVVPSGFHGLAPGGTTDLALALAMGGVPVVTYGEAGPRVLAHERNAFLAEPDERSFISTVNQVLSLPAVQRHALGEEFARYTLHRWTWEPVAEAYADRFAALVGRARIPASFRAA